MEKFELIFFKDVPAQRQDDAPSPRPPYKCRPSLKNPGYVTQQTVLVWKESI
jgi:hypothetical protein